MTMLVFDGKYSRPENFKIVEKFFGLNQFQTLYNFTAPESRAIFFNFEESSDLPAVANAMKILIESTCQILKDTDFVG